MYRDLFLDPILRQKHRLALIAVSLLVLAASQTLFLFLIKGFLQVLFVYAAQPGDVPIETLLPSALSIWLPDLKSVVLDSKALLVWVPVFLLCSGLAKAVAGFGYTLNQQAIALHFGANFRDQMFSSILRLPWFENRKFSAGQWMSVIMNDVLFLQNRLADMMTCFVRGTVLVLSCLVAMMVIHWPTGLVLVGIAPIGAIVMGRTGKRISWYAEKFQRELSRMAAAVLDLRNRFDFVRSQAGEKTEFGRFDVLNRSYYEVMRRSILIRSAFAPALELVGFLVFSIAMILVHRNYLGTEFKGETLVQFFAALGLILKPLKEIGEQISRMAETSGVLRQSLATYSRVRQAEHHGATVESITCSSQNSADGELWIEQLSAGFDGKNEFSAEQLPIRPGRAVAIVGPSGAGKSTLIRTLGGLLPPLIWRASKNWEEVARSTSMVSQDPYLFDESVRANLAYGQESVAENALWQALEAVNLASEIRERKGGLDDLVRPTQGNLSGGQVQRLVVARSLLRDAAIWLFDEATSATDAATERDIVERIIAITHEAQKSLLYVTHRLQWLQKFDEIWFVEEGSVRYRGSYVELLKEPRFAQFVALGEAAGDQRHE